MLDPAALDAALDVGRALFNAGRFWRAHEAWEDAWRGCAGADRAFFQGLIMVAAALYKLEQPGGQPRAMRRLLAKARRRLAPCAPVHRGVDLTALLVAIDRLDEAARGWLTRPLCWQARFDRGLIPTLMAPSP